MSPREIDIADMQCWLVRMAQVRWNMPVSRVIDIFKSNAVFAYVSNLYELLHMSSYDCALDDIERYLAAKGVVVC